MTGPRRQALVAAILGLALAAAPSRAAREAFPVPTTVLAGEALALQPSSPARDRALKPWAERADLPDLLYTLRRSPAELGGSDRLLIEAILKRLPPSRAALARRLEARLAALSPAWARLHPASLAELLTAPCPYPQASVFRVAAVLPDSGDYQGFGQAVWSGIQAGLRSPGRTPTLPLEPRRWSTTDDRPARAVAAFDSAAREAGAVIGALLSTPTVALASAARFASLPLISPTASDEDLGMIGGSVFQIGPSAYERGLRLAQSTLDVPRRVGILVSSAASRPFGLGFAEGSEGLGGTVALQETYAAGGLNFHDAVRALLAKQVEVLFWDGDPREAEALLREMARERVSVRICGGEALSPTQHHDETRILLEGVRYVGEEWEVPREGSTPEAAEHPPTSDTSGSLEVRGFLAGRLVSAAVAEGALCPEEIASYLRSRLAAPPYLRERGFLDFKREGAVLPVFAVTRGRAERVQ